MLFRAIPYAKQTTNYRYKQILIGLTLVLPVINVAHSQNAKDEVYFFNQGKQKFESGNYTQAATYFKTADSLRSNHPVIMRYLALACGQSEKAECVYNYLHKIALINADTALLTESAFNGMQNTPEFSKIKSTFHRINEPVSSSDTAFIIPERDLHPEGLAYDPATTSFFVGSIRKRKVIRRTDGQFSDFISEGLFSASGIAIDSVRRKLWIASPAAPQMVGYTEQMQGKSTVLEFDLKTGKFIQQYAIQDTNNHYFGDLIVHTNGDLFISDSYYPALFRITAGSNKIELFKHFGDLRSIQGLTFSSDGNSLYFADYIQGIFKVDIPNKKIQHIKPIEDLSLKDIDGLYSYRHSLIHSKWRSAYANCPVISVGGWP